MPKLKIRLKICRRCNEGFKIPQKFAKICDKCNKNKQKYSQQEKVSEVRKD